VKTILLANAVKYTGKLLTVQCAQYITIVILKTMQFKCYV